jgi:DNA mismatch endonuclease, patch repair protein
MDILTPEKRSWNMSRIRNRDTKPELALRSALHRLGYRYRLSDKNLPGRPDIVLPKYKAAVFVHGCFWHRHKGCKYAYNPKSRVEFWQHKFEENMARDERNISDIRSNGWIPVVVWECQIKHDLDSCIELLTKQLHPVLNTTCGLHNLKGAA